MDGHFMAIHDQELLGIAQGLKIMNAIGNSLFLFLPLTLFVIGVSLLIWANRLSEDEGELGDFIKWLISALIMVGLIFGPVFGIKQKYEVVLNPIVLKQGDFIIRQVKEVDVDAEAQKLSESQVSAKITSGPLAGLLVIPDRIASLLGAIFDPSISTAIFNRKADINALVCNDPFAIASSTHGLIFVGVSGLTRTDSEQVDLNQFKQKLEDYSNCVASGFDSVISFRSPWNIEWGAVGVVAGSLAVSGGAICAASGVGSIVAPLCGIAAGTIGGLITIGASLISVGGCGDIKREGERIIDGIVNNCVNQGFIKQENADSIRKAAKACFNGQGDQKCGAYMKELAGIARQAKDLTGETIGTGTYGSIRNFIADALATVASGWTNETYFSFNTKIEMLAKAQGIALSILISVFPFIALLSLIPTNRSFMNYHLLISTGITYFLIKLWLIVAGIVVNLAVGRFAGT